MRSYKLFFLLVMISMLTSSCVSRLAGDSVEAIEARSDASAQFLDNIAPDECSYNQYRHKYESEDLEAVLKINKRVREFRIQLEDYFYEDPWLSNTDRIGTAALNDLYYCRDRNGDIPDEYSTTIYCETALPTFVIEAMGKSSYSSRPELRGQVDGLFKYGFVKN